MINIDLWGRWEEEWVSWPEEQTAMQIVSFLLGVLTWWSSGHAKPEPFVSFYFFPLIYSAGFLEASDFEHPHPSLTGVWCACCALAKLLATPWHGSQSFEAEWSFSVAAVEIQHFALYQNSAFRDKLEDLDLDIKIILKRKVKYEIPIHTMKAYRFRRSLGPLLLNSALRD